MNKKHAFFRTLTGTCALVLSLIAAFPAAYVHAATYTYSSNYLTVTVPEDTLVMTQSTSKYDDVWTAAGVTDAEDKLDEFEDMGVVAAFYSPTSGLTVSFISKRTSATVETFTFAAMSDDEIISYMSDVMSSTAEDGLSVDISVVRNLTGSQPFFRMVLDATATDTPCSEVIYGTIINGQMLQFDSYTEGTGAVNETFILQVVRGITFTQILTREDYDALISSARIKLVIVSVIIIAAIAGAVWLSITLRRKRDRRVKAISAAMTDFRVRLKDGSIDTGAAPRYTFTTAYDAELFEEFGVYNAWFNLEPGFITAIVLFAAFMVYMFMTGSILLALLTAVMIIVLLYMHYSASEKAREALMRRYSVKEKPTVTFAFYDEYFTVKGLATAGEYIYKQVTKVTSFRHSVYIFVGDSQALIIRKKDMVGVSVKELKTTIS